MTDTTDSAEAMVDERPFDGEKPSRNKVRQDFTRSLTTVETKDSFSISSETGSSSSDSKVTKAGYKKFQERSCEWMEKGTAKYIKRPLKKAVIEVARISAVHPKKTVLFTILLSVGLLVAGWMTNFYVELDGDILWSPSGSKPEHHKNWINEESGFEPYPRNVRFLIHANGANVLTVEAANCLFDAVDAARATRGYQQVCQASHGKDECPIYAATSIFDHDRNQLMARATTDEEVQVAMSRLMLDDGRPVIRSILFGYPYPELPANLTTYAPGTDPALLDTFSQLGDSAIDTFGSLFGISRNDTILQSAQSYTGDIPLSPDRDISKEYEFHVYNRLYDLNDEWEERGRQCTIEVYSIRAFDDDVMRGILNDGPFMASAFLIMGSFCAFYLSKRKNCVASQSILGAGAVVTIILSIMTGYGLCFVIGVPFSNVSQIFPYVMVGIGLDDTFIITGALGRTNLRADIEDRVVQVMDEVGISIVVSTLTTVAAFFLGCAASLPGIRWFCWYAAPTVLIDFVYQISFFVAIVVLDDRRIRANRYDCLVCVKSSQVAEEDTADESMNDMVERKDSETTLTTKFMLRYSKMLLKPVSKVIVLASFLVFLCLGVYGTLQQRQEFDFRDLTPVDSYIRTYFDALDDYTSPTTSPYLLAGLYFRGVDFSEKETHQKMRTYIDDLVDLEFISNRPEFFWVTDFEAFVERDDSVANMTFNVQMDAFLSTSPYDELYAADIVRNEYGDVTATRSNIIFDKTSLSDVTSQLDTLKSQRRVSIEQEINQDSDDWPFFAFAPIFFVWELFSVVFSEILFSILLGLVSVFVISLLFIPHPFGALVLTPVVAAVYCEIMAFLYLVGIRINGVTAICLIMSVGLVVDYNMHVVLTYFEVDQAKCRNERVQKVLTTMGTSILVGGFSTFLGVLPLSLTGSLVFQTFFYSFLAIPTIGIAHGLILLPVILSLWGPRLKNSSDQEDQEGLDDFFAILPENFKVVRLEI